MAEEWICGDFGQITIIVKIVVPRVPSSVNEVERVQLSWSLVVMPRQRRRLVAVFNVNNIEVDRSSDSWCLWISFENEAHTPSSTSRYVPLYSLYVSLCLNDKVLCLWWMAWSGSLLLMVTICCCCYYANSTSKFGGVTDRQRDTEDSV